MRILVDRDADINRIDLQFLVQRPRVGSLSICARWVHFWPSSLTISPMPSKAGVFGGSRDSSNDFLNCAGQTAQVKGHFGSLRKNRGTERSYGSF